MTLERVKDVNVKDIELLPSLIGTPISLRTPRPDSQNIEGHSQKSEDGDDGDKVESQSSTVRRRTSTVSVLRESRLSKISSSYVEQLDPTLSFITSLN